MCLTNRRPAWLACLLFQFSLLQTGCSGTPGTSSWAAWGRSPSQSANNVYEAQLKQLLDPAKPKFKVGGLLELPPEGPLGSNVVNNPGFENGPEGWEIPKCWSIDDSTGHEGTHSLKFDSGFGCATFAFSKVVRGTGAPRSYTLQGWAKTSQLSGLAVRLTLHDLNDNTYVFGGSGYNFRPGPTWQFIQVKHIDILPIHDGHTLQVRCAIVGALGSAWFDDVQLIEELPPPLSVFLLYPNFRGYLWSNGPQEIRSQVEVSAPDLNKVKIHAVLKTEAGGDIVMRKDEPAQPTQILKFDSSSLALGSYQLQVQLESTSTGQAVSTYPAYRIVKVSDDFQSGLVNYIDTDNFLVRKGKKRFVWGVFDRISAKYRAEGVRFQDAAAIERMRGFAGESTLDNYAECLLNSEMNIVPFAGLPPFMWEPWMSLLDKRGVGHIQILNNWVEGNRDLPWWARGRPNPDLWRAAANMMDGKPGGIGFYTYDEPKPDAIPVVFEQYKVLREGAPGAITWGALIDSRQVFRWRDLSDVISCDPYPVGTVVAVDEVPFGATIPPPMIRTAVWTRETVRQLYGSRPAWMVLQLWRQGGKYPTYEELKTQAYMAIINGATGVLWWGFVWGQGVEGEWYQRNNQQSYSDFKRISHEVMDLEPALISPTRTKWLASVSDSRVEVLVKSDSRRMVVFTNNNSETPVAQVRFAFSGLAPQLVGPVEVYSENRTVTLTPEKSFIDNFGPYEAHVYTLNLK